MIGSGGAVSIALKTNLYSVFLGTSKNVPVSVLLVNLVPLVKFLQLA